MKHLVRAATYGKSTTTLCGAGERCTLRFPHVAGRNRQQELQTHAKAPTSPTFAHGGTVITMQQFLHRDTLSPPGLGLEEIQYVLQ